MLAIVLTCDRLPCPALGCYGNEWVETRHLDRLAAEGFVCDNHVVPWVAASRNPWFADSAAWWLSLRQCGVQTVLIQEQRCAAELFADIPFDLRDVVEGDDQSLGDWPFGQLVRRALGEIGTAQPDAKRILWLHAAGIPIPCRVPEQVEHLFVDEFVERGVDWSQLSPEERAVHPATQAAYVSCVDHCFGELFAAAQQQAGQQPVLMVVAGRQGGLWQSIPRRFSIPVELETQQMRTPCLWWTGTPSSARVILPGRSPALVQPADLGPTLGAWFGSSAAPALDSGLWPLFDGQVPRLRDALVVANGAVWTEHDVTLFPDGGTDLSQARRFLWPEDLWQVNDVAAITPDLVAERFQLWQQRKPPCDDG